MHLIPHFKLLKLLKFPKFIKHKIKTGINFNIFFDIVYLIIN